MQLDVLSLCRINSSGTGAYSLKTYSSGQYYLRLKPTAAFALASSTAVTLDNAVNNDNNGVQPGGSGSDIYSMIFTLTAGGEPGSSGITNTENTIDFGLRSCPTISITSTPSTLPNAPPGGTYSANFDAAGGNSPYTWSLATGSTLPGGFTLSSAGVLSATNITASPGSYTFSVKVTDSSICTATLPVTVQIVCPTLTLLPSSLSAAQQGSSPSHQFSTSGGSPSYTYTLASGTLPAGMILTPTGLLSGTLTALPATYTFTIRSTDSKGCTAQNLINWVITCPTINITTASVPAATQYAAYTNQQLTATGSSGYTWTYTGTLPSGMNLSTAGVLSGTPTSAPGTYNLSVTATDPSGCFKTSALAVVVNCPTLIISNPVFPNGTKNVLYPNQQLSTSGGTAAYQYTLAGGALPTGLSLSNSGLIFGTPSAAPGTYNFTVRVTDAVTCTTTKPLQIVISCPPITIDTLSLPGGVQYAAYSQNLSVSGGTAPYTWTLDSGLLPHGVGLSSGGVLSGVASTLGSYIFDVRVTDVDGCFQIKRYTVTISCPPINITPTTVTDAQRNIFWSQQFSASGGTAAYRFSIVSGSLPAGITLSTTGLLSGTATAATGSYNFTVKALDANDCPGTQPFTLNVICPPITITPAGLTDAVVGTSYSQSLSAAGGTVPYVWSILSGTLPQGLSLSSNGIISGTPSQATTAAFIVEARDAFNCAGTKQYTLTVRCPTISIAPTSLPSGYVSAVFSQQLTAQGGTGPYQFQTIAGAAPAGLTLSTSGLISGTPLAYGTAGFTVRVTDFYGCIANQSFSILIKGLSLGDIIFEDSNYNGFQDNGEPGVKDVTVQLWNPGADFAVGGSGANSDFIITSMTTGALGQYHFTNLQAGRYFVRVLPPAGLPIRTANPVNADNGIDLDNNGVSQPGGPTTAIDTPVIQLTSGGETTAEDGDSDTDFTLDVGLFRGMTIGNLVWQDTNDNALRDPGEPGIDGVTVQVWSAGADGLIGGTDDSILGTTITAGGGAWSVPYLPPVKVYVVIPQAPATQPLSSSATTLADNGVNNDDNGHQIGGGAIYSSLIQLSPANEPGTGGGTYVEDTIDFGLLNVTPTVFVVATHDDSIQAFNAASGLYQGNLVNAFGTSHSQGNGDWGDVPYNLELGPDGNWYAAHYGASNLRKISPTGTDLGSVLNNSVAAVSWISSFAIGPDGNFYVVDVNGNRIVRFQGPGGSTPGAPIGSAPFTFISQAGIVDLNFGPDGNLYLVIQNGSLREVRRYSTTTGALLNTIVNDTELVSMVPGGQPIALVSGIDIHGNTLYGVNRADGEVFRIDLSNPSAPGLPDLVGSISSAGKGFVETADIEFNPANNRLYISGFNWGKPIVGSGSYISGALVEVDLVNAPNGTVRITEVPIPTPPGPNNEIWPGPRDLALGKPFAPLPQSVAIGSVIWNDIDADGIHDAGEFGIPGVRVELWRDLNGSSADGAELLLGWTFTDAAGFYYFSGQAPGVYQVQIPVVNFISGQPLASSGHSSPVTVALDNQIDGDDNGLQPGGNKTVVSSPLITLTPGAEPTGNAISGTERRQGGELDDYSVDANGDMTVDFGFVEPGLLSVGNLIFVDANGNGRYDVGEGQADAVVELYQAGAVPGSDQPFATTTTSSGQYMFNNLWQGQYFVHLPATQFTNLGELRGLYSLSGNSAGDDDTGEDSLDSSSPFITGISTGVFTLANNQAPAGAAESGFEGSSDDANDNNVDLTIDIGLYRPVAIGNLVFADSNSSGAYDAGEGIPNVTVQVFYDTQDPTQDLPIASQATDSVGRFLFDYLRPGNYIIHIPKAMFLNGAPLYQRISINEGLTGDDDVGENGINIGDTTTDGISSLTVSVFPGAAPTDDTGETGLDSTSDNQNDAANDLTIDFGFQTPVGIGNLVYVDQNANGRADTGEGVDDITVELYRANQTPGQSFPVFTSITSGGGKYFFNNLPAGSYIVHIPYTQFELNHPLYGLESIAGASTSAIDDGTNNNDNGIDSANPQFTGISTGSITLATDAEPTTALGETGQFKDIDSFDDNNFDLTIDFGFTASNPNAVGLGNLVWRDLDGDGAFDAGEGVDGVKVQLFNASANPLTTTYLAQTTTANDGIYRFTNLTTGDYRVFIPASEFAPGKPLAGWSSRVGDGGDNSLDDNADENGIDPVSPDTAATSGIFTAPIHLEPDTEPTNSFGESGTAANLDDVDDDNTDLTIDFAFFRAVSVGNLVFIDANYNGVYDSGEGISGTTPVTLELYASSAVLPFDSPIATTTTGVNGAYLFENISPGSYFIRIPPSEFYNAPLLNHASILGSQTGDDNLGEDGLDEGAPTSNGIRSAVFTLSPTSAPSGTQESGFQGTSDDLDDTATDLTIDFGFVPQVNVGNAIFSDDNNDGIFNPNTELGIDGVLVELWTIASGAIAPAASTYTVNGVYNFAVAPGAYYIKIPYSQFSSGGALENRVPSKPNANIPTTTAGDDDSGQDGYTLNSVLTDGARTPIFTILKDSAPTQTVGAETGFLSESDDFTNDTNSDLTIDLGFSPKPLGVGNLVFRDLDSNGYYTANDYGVPNVTVKLYKLGDDPNNAATIPVATTTTQSDGSYLLNAYTAGDYFLHIPKTEFVTGKPLAGTTSISSFGSDDGTDDSANEDGLDAANPSSTGISSIVFTLDYGTEPVESGFLSNSDDLNDTDTDLTIDFGFNGGVALQLMSIGNLVFNDANNNGIANTGEGVPGVWVLLRSSTGNTGSFIRSTYTDANGRYIFSNLNPGTYVVHIAADNFKSSISINGGPIGPGPLYRKLSILGYQNTVGDDQIGEDGMDVQNPEQIGIDSHVVALTANAAPSGAIEGGFQGNSDDSAADNMTDLTIDFGFATRLGVGNLVFRDINADGKFQTGTDVGISGVPVELIHVSPTFTETILATTTTDTSGRYLLYGPPTLTGFKYKVRIPNTQFTNGSPLAFHTASIYSTNGFDDNLNQDGLTTDPTLVGVYTNAYQAAAGAQPTDIDGRETGYDRTSDNDDDANINLTFDFGLKAKAISVGNLVFRDINNNGVFNPGIDQPVPGVLVRLFQSSQPTTATPVDQTYTAANGTYTLYAASAASYYIHIPQTMFQNGAPLAGLTTVTGSGGSNYLADTNKDDLLDENGVDGSNLITEGIRSFIFNLAYGSMPINTSNTQTSGENGYEAFMDDVFDSSGLMTIDFGFQAPNTPPLANTIRNDLSTGGSALDSAPTTFTAWAAATGQSDALADPDSDLRTNLLEYALGTSPTDGHHAARFQMQQNKTTGSIEAHLIRSVISLSDVRYSIEVSTDLKNWLPCPITPRNTQNPDATLSAIYSDIDHNLPSGYFRLTVTLDADLNGTPEATTHSTIHAWTRLSAIAGRQTLSMPLLLPAIFIGDVTTINANTAVIDNGPRSIHTSFQPGTSYYLEVLTGPKIGTLIDIDTAASTGNTITLTTAPHADVRGQCIAIRPHLTLGQLIPAHTLHGSTDQTLADRILFFDSATGTYRIHWLTTTQESQRWVKNGDATLADTASQIIRPSEGMFLQIRSAPATLTLMGELRTTPQLPPTTAGTYFRGTTSTLPQTPASQNHLPGTKLRLWSSDADISTAVFQNYLLNAQSRWIKEGTNTDVTTQPLLQPYRAHFLVK